jgi:diguanylate cyclase (GGDEF)-like protein
VRQGTREPERLLIVGDDHEDRDLLSHRLSGRGYSVDIADDGIDALAKIHAAQYDLILLEQIMPGMSGLDLLRLLRATYSSSDLPVIMVASEDQGAPVVEALNDGANDYVTKPVNMPVVAARIQAQLARVKQERQTRENEQRIDPVTGLANRLAVLEHLADRLENQTGPISILLLDLDAFKVVNDSFGHAAGDGILCEIGVRLRDAILGSGLVARIGGDEFAVVLDSLVSDAARVQLAEQILTAVSHPIPIRGRQISIGASIGIVTSAAGAAEDLLGDADLAMYRAKELGKNRWHVFETELRDRAQTRMVLVHDMHNAAKNGQLLALYQPKVELKTRRIVGFEALLRWQHPERGILFPASFIPLAEETGLIVPIGEWILREACWQLRRWQDRFPAPAPLTMNVNLSVRQIADPALVDRVRGILEETGIAPETLNLELTETSLMSDLETAKSVLRQLQALRIGLKLDDFGTGYSSLAYLRALHFDCLKIDRSFVAKMMVDSESHIIVETIVKLAHALEMSVVAEGIEEQPQVDELIRLGCDVGQGFYFSRPVEAPDAESQLRTSPR